MTKFDSSTLDIYMKAFHAIKLILDALTAFFNLAIFYTLLFNKGFVGCWCLDRISTYPSNSTPTRAFAKAI